MMEDRFTVGIVGLGLMGGSAARAIKGRTPCRVLGGDRDEVTLRAALECRAIDGALDRENLKECRLILLALTPDACIAFMEEMAPQVAPGTVVVDFCGVKRYVSGPLNTLAERYGFVYIGGHSMAGLERSGFAWAREDLFDGASMILTPSTETDAGLLQEIESFFKRMGFDMVQYSCPQEHDRMIAYTSQLAHVLSSAYIKSPNAMHFKGFSAGSFRDLTRVARMNSRMWSELFLENGDYLAAEIEALCQRLSQYAAVIRGGNRQALMDMIDEGTLIKEKLEAEQ